MLIILFLFCVFLIVTITTTVICCKKETLKDVQQKRIQKHTNNIKMEEFLTKVPFFDKSEHDRYLYKLYYEGVPDTYDYNGNKIRGYEPDAKKAIHYLNNRIKDCHLAEDVLRLAKIYHLGMHKFEPQLDKAFEIYVKLKNQYEKMNKTDSRIYIDVIESLNDIHKQRVYAWLNLPNNTNNTPPVNTDNIPVNTTNTVNNTNWEVENEDELILNLLEYRPRRRVHFQRIENGNQNVHESQVISTINHSIDNLKKTTGIKKSENATLNEIKQWISQKEDNDKKEDALQSLKAIVRNKIPLSSSNMTEMDALNLVWNRIHTDMHKDKLEDLKNNLFNELADMTEHGSIVCATGRFNRIIDTLNIVDPDVIIKPFNVIKEEMMSKSAKIRENLFNQVQDEVEREKLKMGTSVNQDSFDNKLKREIRNALKQDYVDTKILSQIKLDNEINTWIDYI